MSNYQAQLAYLQEQSQRCRVELFLHAAGRVLFLAALLRVWDELIIALGLWRGV